MLPITLVICGVAAYLTRKYLADEPVWLRIVIYAALLAVALVIWIRNPWIGA
jgi:hypothetical protein